MTQSARDMFSNNIEKYVEKNKNKETSRFSKYFVYIRKHALFKYTENFTTKKGKMFI